MFTLPQVILKDDDITITLTNPKNLTSKEDGAFLKVFLLGEYSEESEKKVINLMNVFLIAISTTESFYYTHKICSPNDQRIKKYEISFVNDSYKEDLISAAKKTQAQYKELQASDKEPESKEEAC